MGNIGVLLYGYHQNQADIIKASLDTMLNEDVTIISASKKEDQKISDILKKGPEDCFVEQQNKLMMFLAFTKGQIDTVLRGFPKIEDLERPIFCGLTKQNLNWPLSELIAHLLEEDEYWTKRGK